MASATHAVFWGVGWVQAGRHGGCMAWLRANVGSWPGCEQICLLADQSALTIRAHQLTPDGWPLELLGPGEAAAVAGRTAGLVGAAAGARAGAAWPGGASCKGQQRLASIQTPNACGDRTGAALAEFTRAAPAGGGRRRQPAAPATAPASRRSLLRREARLRRAGGRPSAIRRPPKSVLRPRSGWGPERAPPELEPRLERLSVDKKEGPVQAAIQGAAARAGHARPAHQASAPATAWMQAVSHSMLKTCTYIHALN